jgi:20S proteasome alpha/beta subunit
MDGPTFDRSRFIDRELFDPARVMEGPSPGGRAAGAQQIVGEHTEGNLDFLKQAVDLGTSIMAVAYDGGVVIGADSRTSTGVYISNRVSDKVTAVDDRIFVCRSGSAADTQAVSDYVTYFLDQHKMEYGQAPKVQTAANFFRQLCYNNKNNLMAGIIVAGWDKHKGGQVYSIPIGGALLERPYAIGGRSLRPIASPLRTYAIPPASPDSTLLTRLPLHSRGCSQALAQHTSTASAMRTSSPG